MIQGRLIVAAGGLRLGREWDPFGARRAFAVIAGPDRAVPMKEGRLFKTSTLIFAMWRYSMNNVCASKTEAAGCMQGEVLK